MEARRAALPPPYTNADLANGEALAGRCRACHTLAPGGRHLVGPALGGFLGQPGAAAEGFAYSGALRAAGLVWDFATLDRWLQDPRGLVAETSMIYQGLDSADDRRDLIAYLAIVTSE